VSPAARPTTKKDEAAAALKEGSGEPRSITVRGTTFELPAEQPFEVLFAARTANSAQQSGDEGAGAVAFLELAESYVGADRLRNFVRGMSMREGSAAVRELIEAINAEYGADTGESSASSSS
jgi:hypothetical protein